MTNGERKVTVFHGTRAVRAAIDISNKRSDLYHVYRADNPTPNLSTVLEDAWVHAVGGAVLEFEVPARMLVLAGMADPNDPVKWYTSDTIVAQDDERRALPHDFREYLADPLHFIRRTDITAPSRWPKDLIITVLSAAYFHNIYFSR